MPRLRIGASLLEILVLLTVLVLGLTAFVRSDWQSAERRAAVELARSVVASRTVALVVGHAVSVGPIACPESSTVEIPHFVSEMIVGYPDSGLQFTPDGLPRTCDGGGVGNTTILLEHRGRQAAVVVSSLGRVRWEMR